MRNSVLRFVLPAVVVAASLVSGCAELPHNGPCAAPLVASLRDIRLPPPCAEPIRVDPPKFVDATRGDDYDRMDRGGGMGHR